MIKSRFRGQGWRTAKFQDWKTLSLTLLPRGGVHENISTTAWSSIETDEILIDNIKNRVVVMIDRTGQINDFDEKIKGCKVLYNSGIIDAGVIITRTREDLRALAKSLDSASSKFFTSTTKNLRKLEPRLTGGDAGGCPVLAIAISARCLNG